MSINPDLAIAETIAAIFRRPAAGHGFAQTQGTIAVLDDNFPTIAAYPPTPENGRVANDPARVALHPLLNEIQ
jgi:hypothetical protein